MFRDLSHALYLREKPQADLPSSCTVCSCHLSTHTLINSCCCILTYGLRPSPSNQKQAAMSHQNRENLGAFICIKLDQSGTGSGHFSLYKTAFPLTPGGHFQFLLKTAFISRVFKLCQLSCFTGAASLE